MRMRLSVVGVATQSRMLVRCSSPTSGHSHSHCAFRHCALVHGTEAAQAGGSPTYHPVTGTCECANAAATFEEAYTDGRQCTCGAARQSSSPRRPSSAPRSALSSELVPESNGLESRLTENRQAAHRAAAELAAVRASCH
eukprot:7380959-Prymnesium_polylepis.2